MERQLINLTNHPSEFWGKEQTDAAREYGEIIDVPFPDILPTYNDKDIQALAEVYAGMIEEMQQYATVSVHVMGEMTFTYAVVSRLKAIGIRCIASTTERNTVVMPDGKKVSEFKFVRFRDY